MSILDVKGMQLSIFSPRPNSCNSMTRIDIIPRKYLPTFAQLFSGLLVLTSAVQLGTSSMSSPPKSSSSTPLVTPRSPHDTLSSFRSDASLLSLETMPPPGLPIFFKVDERVKKAYFNGSTLKELRDLFSVKYADSGWSLDNIPTLHISDPKSNIVYELEDVADLYEYCIIELCPKRAVELSGFGYFVSSKRSKLVIAMVGLPARGKSFIARKMARYLNWLGVKTQVFNVGVYRRKRLGARQDPKFFDPDNSEGSSQRMHMAVAALDDMVQYLDHNGRVAIYDATNSTQSRQQLLTSRCSQENFDLMWVESICDDEEVIEENIRETKLTSPDYEGMDAEMAAADFRNRIALYKKSYSTISDPTVTYVKLIDAGESVVAKYIPVFVIVFLLLNLFFRLLLLSFFAGRQIVINNVRSYLQSKIVFFLSNLHTASRYIWLSRHGESEFNQNDRLGGDSGLTDAGVLYSQRLADWMMERSAKPIHVWTSTLRRTIETAQYIPTAKLHLRALDEIDAGDFDGWTYNEIEQKAPEEFRLRSYDKLNYRYPRGESYTDVIARLEPVIFELERTKQPILIIAHQAVLRCLYGYLQNRDPSEVPFIPIPLNTVIQLQPRAYGCVETRFVLDGVTAPVTHNPK
jgi:broad specificity phosphatase PhoE